MPSCPSIEHPFDWQQVFARRAPRILDVGCGDGRFLLASALAHPERDHLGIEVLAPLLAKGRLEAERLQLANLRFLEGDAVRWLRECTSDTSIDEIHAYHPQPYDDPAVVHLGMLSAAFFERAWQVLRPGGILVLQTDSRPYAKHLLLAAQRHFDPVVQPGPWPDAPQGRTHREEVALRKRLTILRVVASRRETPLDVEVPPPYFEGRRRPGLPLRRHRPLSTAP